MQNKNIFALIIGVGDYEKIGIANLPTYRMDIALIGTALENGLKVPGDNIRIVAGEGHDGYVPMAALAHAIADFKSQLGGEDIFIFYFSGHGRERHIIFSDGQVELQSVINFIEELPAGSKLAIIDCCYSGNFKSSGARTMDFEVSMAAFAGKGIAVLASSSADEVSRLGPTGNYSMFTGALSAAINLKWKTHEGKRSLVDIYEDTMQFVNDWNRQNPDRQQKPIFRSSMGGTTYFQVKEYHPYQQKPMQYVAVEYRLVKVKPLSVGMTKRLAAFIVTEDSVGKDDLPAITKEVAEEIKYAAVFETEFDERKLKGLPAKAIWCYFGHNDSDIKNSLHYAYTIWAADDENRQKYFREDHNTCVMDGICVFWNSSYGMIKQIQAPTKSREKFIEDNQKLLASIVSMAERFIYDLQEVYNGTLFMDQMQARYGSWIMEVRKSYILLSDEDVAPDDLHDWSEEIGNLAGWVADLAILLENECGGEKTGGGKEWLMKHAINRYHESMERLKAIEQNMYF